MSHEGLKLAREGKFKRALKIAAKLERLRFTGCFEIKAIVLNGQDDRHGPIETLRHSLDVKPVWRNGHLLGIYLSDAGLYSEALEACDASLLMHAPEPKATAFNKTITLDRMDRPEDAITLLTNIPNDEVDDEPEITKEIPKFLSKLRANTSRG